MRKNILTIGMIVVLGSMTSFGAEYFLDAFKASGKDGEWVNRGGGWMGLSGDHVTDTYKPIWWNSFPGPTGTYKVEILAGIECDGAPKYKLEIGSNKICEGRYPDAGSGCDDCGVKSRTLTCASSASVANGVKVTFYGSDEYPCGDHGAYTRFKGINFVGTGGTVDPVDPIDPSTPATKIKSPSNGATLNEGQEYTLTAEGKDVSWSYDANSDGAGVVNIGTGLSVKLKVPTGVSDPRTISITASGANGTDQVDCTIGGGATGVTRSVVYRSRHDVSQGTLYTLHGSRIGTAAGSRSAGSMAGIYLVKTPRGVQKVCIPAAR